MIAGDILLVRDYTGDSDWLGELIMAGERARYGDSDYARWTHSALIVSDKGDIVEALASGVERRTVGKYNHVETKLISPTVSADMRAYACAFAESHVGDKYDVLDFVSLAATLLTGLDLSLHSDARFICSGLVARATECYTQSGYQYPSEQMMPADIGVYFKALSGDPLPALSRFARLLDVVKTIGRTIF